MHVGSNLIFTISSFIEVCGNRLKYVWVASGIIGATPTTFVNVYFGIILVYFHLIWSYATLIVNGDRIISILSNASLLLWSCLS
jgi:uncharacterized membrane protein